MKSGDSTLALRDRRGFLRDLITTSSSIAVLSVASGIGVASASTQSENRVNGTSQGYRETQHVLDYYRTASF